MTENVTVNPVSGVTATSTMWSLAPQDREDGFERIITLHFATSKSWHRSKHCNKKKHPPTPATSPKTKMENGSVAKPQTAESHPPTASNPLLTVVRRHTDGSHLIASKWEPHGSGPVLSRAKDRVMSVRGIKNVAASH
jgi:hypothetical protein